MIPVACTFRALVLAVGLMAAMPISAAGQQIREPDFSGLDAFWAVFDTLSADAEPSDRLWDELWSTPGYALLDEREHRRSDLTRAFRLAFTPSRASERTAALDEDSWVGYVLSHLLNVEARRGDIEAFQRTAAEGSLLAEAKRRAQEYLPPGAVDVARAEVSFIIFRDARGFDRILLDPLYLLSIRHGNLMLGHELHHRYRGELAVPYGGLGEDWTAWTLTTTEQEGIAGMVDKRDVPGMTDDELHALYPLADDHAYFSNYQIEYARSNQWLAWTEAMLERIAADPNDESLAMRFHRGIPDGGRIMGAFMAATIEDELGRDALIEVVGDPFAFWALYNDAASRTEGRAFVLSAEAMSMIAEKRRRYAPAPG